MAQAQGRITRRGQIHFGNASLHITEDGIAAARLAGATTQWEQTFKREVFARIVNTLNKLGWTCIVPPDYIKQYSESFARNWRYCTKGDLKADLSISGRCIELKMFQNVNAPDRADHEGRYQHDQEKHMPYLMRLEMERTRRRIRTYLCNVFTDYVVLPPAPKMGVHGATAMDMAQHRRRTSGHYRKELDRAEICNPAYAVSADGGRLENGMKVYAIDYHDRVIYGTAFYDLNGSWMVVTGRHHVAYNIWHKQIYVACPGDPRIKRNAAKRRKRLEGEMARAVASMKFERAALLRDILFPGNPPLYNVWHTGHQLYHRSNFQGYTSNQAEAGKFTADEVRAWVKAPNQVRHVEGPPARVLEDGVPA